MDVDEDEVKSGVDVTGRDLIVDIEVVLKTSSSVETKVIEDLVDNLFRQVNGGNTLEEGRFEVPFRSDEVLLQHVQEVSAEVRGGGQIWEAEVKVHVFRLSDEGPYDETTEDDPSSSVFTHWELPAKQFHGLWESLLFEVGIKNHLLEFASTSLLFSSLNIDPNIICWNHVVLLYGPPGTGKTSLCQALAQKLSVRLNDKFKSAQLLEINSHSLFSKWFSESGKLVSKLFSYVHELAEDTDTLVCILIDEVESLAAARSASLSGSEPSDSIRVVNALLTQIDRLKTRKNVMILTTSNITEAIDVAFVDRADIRQYIGLPSSEVREKILWGCVKELIRTGVVKPEGGNDIMNAEEKTLLSVCARLTDGISGRALRKLPFQAHARYVRRTNTSLINFLQALARTAEEQAAELRNMNPA